MLFYGRFSGFDFYNRYFYFFYDKLYYKIENTKKLAIYVRLNSIFGYCNALEFALVVDSGGAKSVDFIEAYSA